MWSRRSRFRFWVTEFGWDTNPPRKHAASLSLAARWTAESLHQMWLSGVSLVTWFLLEDFPKGEPVPERPLLPFLVGRRARAPSPCATAVPVPLRRLPAPSEDGQRLGPRRDQRQGDASPSSAGTARAALANCGADPLERSTASSRRASKLKATKKDWLRASATGSGQLARVLAHGALEVQHRVSHLAGPRATAGGRPGVRSPQRSVRADSDRRSVSAPVGVTARYLAIGAAILCLAAADGVRRASPAA